MLHTWLGFLGHCLWFYPVGLHDRVKNSPFSTSYLYSALETCWYKSVSRFLLDLPIYYYVCMCFCMSSCVPCAYRFLERSEVGSPETGVTAAVSGWDVDAGNWTRALRKHGQCSSLLSRLSRPVDHFLDAPWLWFVVGVFRGSGCWYRMLICGHRCGLVKWAEGVLKPYTLQRQDIKACSGGVWEIFTSPVSSIRNARRVGHLQDLRSRP